MSIASVLTVELLRITRKEVRGELRFLKEAVASSHREIAALKRRADMLEKALRRDAEADRASKPPSRGAAESIHKARLGPRGLAARRRRLGLSARECGLLVGASSQSIYNWEAGKGRPRGKHLKALESLFAMSTKTVAAHLDEIERRLEETGTTQPP